MKVKNNCVLSEKVSILQSDKFDFDFEAQFGIVEIKNNSSIKEFWFLFSRSNFFVFLLSDKNNVLKVSLLYDIDLGVKFSFIMSVYERFFIGVKNDYSITPFIVEKTGFQYFKEQIPEIKLKSIVKSYNKTQFECLKYSAFLNKLDTKYLCEGNFAPEILFISQNGLYKMRFHNHLTFSQTFIDESEFLILFWFLEHSYNNKVVNFFGLLIDDLLKKSKVSSKDKNYFFKHVFSIFQSKFKKLQKK